VSEVQFFLTETSSRPGDRHFFVRDYCYAVTYLSWSLVIKILSAVKRENFCQDVCHNIEEKQLGSIGRFQLGTLDFDFGFRISDFGFPNKTRNPKTDFDEPKSFSKMDFN